VRRREFITVLGGAAAWPVAVRAQQGGKPPTIGFLGAISPTGFAKQLAGFRLGLRDRGLIEGANVIVEYRWAEGNYERLPDLVTQFVQSNAAVIVTHGTPGWIDPSDRRSHHEAQNDEAHRGGSD
jgi:putative tryptophan/tyrosine transport system substrate-binding protein